MTLRVYEKEAAQYGNKEQFLVAFRQFVARLQGGYVIKVSAGRHIEYKEIKTRYLGGYIRGKMSYMVEV